MDLIYFFKVLYRKKWIMLLLSFIAVVATFFFKLAKPQLYVSQAQYSTGFTAEKVRMIDGSSGVDMFAADTKFNNVIETFKSPRVINAIGYKLLLNDLQHPEKAYRKLTKKQMESALYRDISIDSAVRNIQNAVLENRLLSSNTVKERLLIEYFELYGYDYASLMDGLTIERVDRTDYLNIYFRSENPELSAVVVNAMGQEFLNYYRNLSSQRTEESAEGIRKIVNAQQTKVDSLGRQLYNEKVKQGSIDPVSLSTSAMETVKELETALASEKSKQNEHLNRKQYLTTRLSELTGGGTGTSGTGTGNDEVIRLTNRKNDLVAELARKNGNDDALEKQIADLRSEIAKASRAASGGGRNAAKDKEINDLKMQIAEEDALLRAASTTIIDYTSRIRKYTGMATSAPVGSDVTISGIQSQLSLENAQLGSVMEKLTQAKGLVKDDPTANFIQTGVGQPAIGPESKKTLRTMIVAGMSMFFLTSVIFLLLEVFDSKLKTPSIFRRQVKLNLVNTLNNVPLKKISEQEIVKNDFVDKKHAKETIFKNEIKKVRFELLKSSKQVYLFTSTQKGAGKSTIIDALAMSLVLSNKKVLLVDLNLANPSITRKYSPDVLMQNLPGKIKLDTPLFNQKVWSKTDESNLFVLGCEQSAKTPSEEFFDLDMALLFENLKTNFDYILIEAAALNDVVDSQELCLYSEAVFTVFSANNSVTLADTKSITFINSLGEKNKGTILNNVLKENLNF